MSEDPRLVALAEANPAPIPMFLTCPGCGARHIDEGEFATKAHHTHACQSCGLTWRPAIVPTVGVRFLPGFKDALRAFDQQGEEVRQHQPRDRSTLDPDNATAPAALVTAGADPPWLDEAALIAEFAFLDDPSMETSWAAVVRAVHAFITAQAPSLRLLDIVSSQIDAARAEGRREAIEECKKIATAEIEPGGCLEGEIWIVRRILDRIGALAKEK